MLTKGVEGEQSSTSAQGRKQERVEKILTSGNYKCKRDNKWMGGRESHAR